jgi:hypothetical protein
MTRDTRTGAVGDFDTDHYLAKLYDVISSTVHKYTSTHVSGGGGYTSGHISSFSGGGYVSGNTAPITSRVEEHSDQEIWLKDVETGEEERYEFKSFNVPAREGHRFLLAWNRQSRLMERAVNVTAGETFAAHGVYNDWTGPARAVRRMPGRIWLAFKKSLVPTLLTLTLLHPLYVLYTFVFRRKGMLNGVRAERLRPLGIGMVVFAAVMVMSFATIAMEYGSLQFTGVVVWLSIVLAGLTAAHTAAMTFEFDVIKRHSDALDSHLAQIIEADRKKTIVRQSAGAVAAAGS